MKNQRGTRLVARGNKSEKDNLEPLASITRYKEGRREN